MPSPSLLPRSFVSNGKSWNMEPAHPKARRLGLAVAQAWDPCPKARKNHWMAQPARGFDTYAPDADPPRNNLAAEFERLREQWLADTLLDSSAVRIAMHPAYQRIIGMGESALPLILADLATQPAHWFWALRAIAGKDAAEGAMSMEEARQRWLAWGQSSGWA